MVVHEKLLRNLRAHGDNRSIDRRIRFNKACELARGYSFEEVRKKHARDVCLTPEDVKPVKGVFANLKAGQFPNRFENYWVTKNGRRLLWTTQ